MNDGARALARFNVYRGAAKEMPDPLPLSEWKRPERRAPLAPNVSDFILRFSIGFAVLFGATSMGAADTNSVSGTDFQAFKIIAERNIFNPVRSGRVAQTAKPKPVKIDTVTLVGASSSETGRFAFFDGSSSEFRKVVKRGDSLADVDVSRLHQWLNAEGAVQDTVPKKAGAPPATPDTAGVVRRVSPKDSAPGLDVLRRENARMRAMQRKGVEHDTSLARVGRERTAARVTEQTTAAIKAVAAQPTHISEGDSSANVSRVNEAKLRLEISQRARDRYVIEINKKFSLAAACLIFAILAPPIALRFPRGGVGLVIGVSLLVFALYYVGLIGGEAAANNGYVPPFWAMWGTNVIMTLIGVVMLLRMGRDQGSARGGGIREWLDERRFLREEKRAAANRGTA